MDCFTGIYPKLADSDSNGVEVKTYWV
ncbi:uncharacterized protein METZ01_LOCUS324809 [marine metagenome]|uniref:Uncharacterized protein n=1 Tax=marine metagenome TaxID=408172 RepID=A0A382PH42_9ZZZZ